MGSRSGTPGAAAALAAAEPDAIIICPSNPYLSIDPMLEMPALQDALSAIRVPIVAVSPLVGGRAVKGPTAKIMAELDIPQSVTEIARHYAGLIDGLVIDDRDEEPAPSLGIPFVIADTMMTTLADRERVARATLELAAATGGACRGS